MLTEFDHFRIAVSDIGRSRDFYRYGLGLAEIHVGEAALPLAKGGGKSAAAVFQLGPTLFEIFQVPAGQGAGMVQHLGIRTTDLEADKALLAGKPHVKFLDGPSPTCAPGLIATLGGRRMAWFTDPDGLNLALTEVAHPEKPAGPLDGIDHVQINATDYQTSLDFYQNELGFAVERVALFEGKKPTGEGMEKTKGERAYTMLGLGRTRFEIGGVAAEGALVRVGFTSHMGWLCSDPVAYFKEVQARAPECLAEKTKDGPAFNARGHVFRRFKFNLFDPDGLLLQMVQPHPEVDPAARVEGETGGGLVDPGSIRLIKTPSP